MNYNVSASMWNKVFAVPSDIIDKHLKNLKETEIKVLLYLLRFPDKKIDLREISQGLETSEEKIKDACENLKNYKIIEFNPDCLNDSSKETNEKPKTFECENALKKIPRYKKPNTLYVAERVQNSEEIYFLMQEAQVILGRPISNGDSAALLMLHDNEGLPADVIIMLLQYAVSAGKSGMKYIEKLGMDWAEKGIDSLEKAEKKIKSLNMASIIWRRFESLIGIDRRAPTAKEEEAVTRWFTQWNYGDDLIKEAYDRCVNANGKYILKYMDSIIKRWQSQGIFKIEQALNENSKRTQRSKSAQAGAQTGASYDIEEYENYNIFDYYQKLKG